MNTRASTSYLNPFTPSFGETPAYLAGRENVVGALRKAFTSPVRRPELTTVITGARGSGKTAMLSIASDEALQNGWIAVNVMCMKGMLDDIYIQTVRQAQHLVHTKNGPRVSGFGVGEIIKFDITESPAEGNWRSKMSDLLDELAQHSVGLVITVDEVQAKLEEMVHLVAIYQLFVREQRKISLIAAGLPHNISSLLQDKAVSFLRRAQLCRLERLSDTDVRVALQRTVESAGRRIGAAALDAAVEASDGFPFMMQLVGYHAWENRPSAKEIKLEDVKSGATIAAQIMNEQILGATYVSLSDGDKKFLRAMTEDANTSKLTDIAQRLGKSSAYVTQYKYRLMEQGLIEEYGRGELRFELPLLREFILRQG